MNAISCPSCGAPIQFRWSGAVQVTCEYCRSILVRQDMDLARVGEVADLPDDASPLQIGCEGVYKSKPFQLVGRIIYEYEQGLWNEWHMIFNDGSSGWLSDAMLEFAVSFLRADAAVKIPDPTTLARGFSAVWDSKRFELTTRTHAHYVGVEGELPFQYWDKGDVVFADFRSYGGEFATIDGTETPPLLYLGEFVEFSQLKLNGLRQFEGWN